MDRETRQATLQQFRDRDRDNWPKGDRETAQKLFRNCASHVENAFAKVEAAIEGGDVAVKFTQGLNDALRTYLAGLRYLTYDLARVEAEQRRTLELRVAELEARVGVENSK